jgi:hypothetical protein
MREKLFNIRRTRGWVIEKGIWITGSPGLIYKKKLNLNQEYEITAV